MLPYMFIFFSKRTLHSFSCSLSLEPYAGNRAYARRRQNDKVSHNLNYKQSTRNNVEYCNDICPVNRNLAIIPGSCKPTHYVKIIKISITRHTEQDK